MIKPAQAQLWCTLPTLTQWQQTRLTYSTENAWRDLNRLVLMQKKNEILLLQNLIFFIIITIIYL